MRRVLYDVPRWDIYQHRAARGLPTVQAKDDSWMKFQDELFEILYSGDVEKLSDKNQDAKLAAWAERVHNACTQLPDFGRLANQCRGDVDMAAAATDELQQQLVGLQGDEKNPETPEELRRSLRHGIGKAAKAIEEINEIKEGLEGVQFNSSEPGSGTMAPMKSAYHANYRTLAERLKRDNRLKQIALLAGRFKRIAASKQKQKVKHGVDEVNDVEQGGEISRLLPAELCKIRHPKLRTLLMRDLLERKALQYHLSGVEALGKGPLVVALDKSGSMEGQPDIWATAVSLALLEIAHRQRRSFVLLTYDAYVTYEAIIPEGEPLPVEALFTASGGGTNIDRAMKRGLELIRDNPGALKRADLVIVSDGGSNSLDAASLRQWATSLGVTVYGVGIGIPASEMSPWCDDVRAVQDLETIDDDTASTLFSL